MRVMVWFVDGPAAGRFERVPVDEAGLPPEEYVFTPGTLFVGTSDHPTPAPPPARYVLQPSDGDPLADWVYTYAPERTTT